MPRELGDPRRIEELSIAGDDAAFGVGGVRTEDEEEEERVEESKP